MRNVLSALLCVGLAGMLGCAKPETPTAEQPQVEQPESSESEVVKVGYWPAYEEDELEKNKLKFYLVDPEEEVEIQELLLPSRNSEWSAAKQLAVPVEWVTAKGKWNKYEFDQIIFPPAYGDGWSYPLRLIFEHRYMDSVFQGSNKPQINAYKVIKVLEVKKQLKDDSWDTHQRFNISSSWFQEIEDESLKSKIIKYYKQQMEGEPYQGVNVSLKAVSCIKKKVYKLLNAHYVNESYRGGSYTPKLGDENEIRDEKLVEMVCK